MALELRERLSNTRGNTEPSILVSAATIDRRNIGPYSIVEPFSERQSRGWNKPRPENKLVYSLYKKGYHPHAQSIFISICNYRRILNWLSLHLQLGSAFPTGS
ncbi:hypothetical protein AMTR_s01901p00009070 [Amborella trichopoda]|uniref:Uncharacterized protein n=1 Tax=Amborella trichopoda TaxID=13333 RepID=W1NRD2_AMBTC|nr:hypothetical protein AMTR_s01901p00009070 [Amborella trichopoda]